MISFQRIPFRLFDESLKKLLKLPEACEMSFDAQKHLKRLKYLIEILLTFAYLWPRLFRLKEATLR